MDDAGPSIILASVEPMLNTLQATANAKSLIWQVPLLIILILVNAFFAMSEIAIISLNDAKIEKQADEGKPRSWYHRYHREKERRKFALQSYLPPSYPQERQTILWSLNA